MTLNEQAKEIFDMFINLSSGDMDKEVIEACRKKHGKAGFSLLTKFAREYNTRKCAIIYIDGLITYTQTIYSDLSLKSDYFLSKMSDLIQIKTIIQNM